MTFIGVLANQKRLPTPQICAVAAYAEAVRRPRVQSAAVTGQIRVPRLGRLNDWCQGVGFPSHLVYGQATHFCDHEHILGLPQYRLCATTKCVVEGRMASECVSQLRQALMISHKGFQGKG